MKYYKAIAFCSNPILGHFKFKDVFQIYPLDFEKAPQVKSIKYYSFVLEYCATEADQVVLEGELKELSGYISELKASSDLQGLILKLLTAFSNYHFFVPSVQAQWFLRLDLPEEEMNNQISMPGMSKYYFPEMREWGKINGFTDLKTNEIEPQEHPACFQHIDTTGTDPVKFSKYIYAAIHNYFLLSEQQLASVNSSLELINQGVKIMGSIKSLSFVAFISAVETMVNLEYLGVAVERCKACKAEQFKVMAKFRDYLFEYVVNDAANKKVINELYNLRSKIAHTGLLMFGDGKMDFASSKDRDNQENMHLQAMMISRLSLMNWILKRSEKQESKEV